MSLYEQLKDIAVELPDRLPLISTEEATKTALVLPFLKALGYNIHDPSEVLPEFTADVGIKKGEKVDYAIMLENQPTPIIIIECKAADQSLDGHKSQLFRYFNALQGTRVAILTNGIEYRFFSDLESENRLDDRPFLVCDVRAITEQVAVELSKLCKKEFNIEKLLASANEIKTRSAIKEYLLAQMAEPSEEFIRHLAGELESCNVTRHVVDFYRDLVKQAMAQLVTDRINAKFNAMMSKETPPSAGEKARPAKVGEVETTELEIQAYFIVKAVLAGSIDLGRVAMRDAKSYFSVLLDDNNRKPICRLHTKTKQMYLGLFDSDEEDRVPIGSVGEIYGFAMRLKSTVTGYGSEAQESAETG